VKSAPSVAPAQSQMDSVGDSRPRDGRHFVQPPQEIRRIAAQPGIGLTAILEASGNDEIEARVASAYEHWVGSEGS
jgi:hypothetical protein